MTHEQKEAFRPEVLIKRLREVYGNLTPGAIDHADLDGMAFTVKEVIEALAASQPAPTADTGQVSIWGVWNGWAWETHGDEETARKHLSRNGERPVVEFRSVPAADAGQAVAWTEKGLREYAIKQGLPLRERASVPDLQRGGTIHPFHVEFRSEALVDLLNAQAHPAPLDAERVREDYADKLFADACKPVSEGGPGAFMDIASWIKRKGAMLPAERAALRQKEAR